VISGDRRPRSRSTRGRIYDELVARRGWFTYAEIVAILQRPRSNSLRVTIAVMVRNGLLVSRPMKDPLRRFHGSDRCRLEYRATPPAPPALG
jgi:hypothetical protein